jgi:hypothetical protein
MKITEALSKDEMVDNAGLVNHRIARHYLNRDRIREKANVEAMMKADELFKSLVEDDLS